MTASSPRTRKGWLSREDDLSPPAVPTGQPPKDVLNTIWRKNDVFIDIGDYSIGSAVMIIWPGLLLESWFIYLDRNSGGYFWGSVALAFFIIGIPILILIYGLFKPVPQPMRFNRQRREVCVPFPDGRYWIVPWEQVSAQAIATDSIGPHGKTTQGMLFIGFHNPNEPEDQRDYCIGFYCGGGRTAMCLWECMRSYMEIGPDAVPPCSFEGERSGKGLIGWIFTMFFDVVKSLLKGNFITALKEFFFTVFLGVPLAFYLQERKLFPPPDLTHPNIIEWSKPLPPDQWAQRSPELEEAIRVRQAELDNEAKAA